MDDETDRGQAELRRLEAERHKLELEAKEIERRLNAKWWQGGNLTQYLLALVITAALLFGWTRVYLEPILRKETEINALAERRNATLNELLEAQNRQIREQQAALTTERDRLKQEAARLQVEKGDLVTERDRLAAERESLEKRQQELQLIVAGLRLAVEQAAAGKGKFFSILNSDDPINALKRSHGWELWSDNYYGRLGYYLIIQHPDVRSGKEIIVGRRFEIEDLKGDQPDDWHDYIEKINSGSRGGPVLALDYSYLGLLVDPEAAVGGILYQEGGEETEFYAPLVQWAEQLGAFLPE